MASKLGSLLQRIVCVYRRAGFTVQTILMDNEFEKVRDQVPDVNMNVPAAEEHISEIERRIRVIKECSRGIICILPYPQLPQMMLIHLLHFIVMWLNNFPFSTGISSRWSPRELILCHRLHYDHHCRAPFGAYCEAHEDHKDARNSMKTRGTPSICLGPTGNIQGTYNFPSLPTGLIIKRCTWNELPVPQLVIDHVTKLAQAKSVSNTLIFANCKRIPFDWLDNSFTSLDPTPIGAYPDIPAKMPGVLIDCFMQHPPSTRIDLPDNDEPDWTALADATMENADLDHAVHLPPAPEVIEIDDYDNDEAAPSLLPYALC
jgi:hypothetical protein